MIKGDENGLVQTHLHEFPGKNQSDNSSRSLLGLGNPGIHRLQPLVLTRMQGLRGKECDDLLSTSGGRKVKKKTKQKHKKSKPRTSEQQMQPEINNESYLRNLAIVIKKDYNIGMTKEVFLKSFNARPMLNLSELTVFHFNHGVECYN